MNKNIIIILLTAIIILLAITLILSNKKSEKLTDINTSRFSKYSVCPDEWIVNKMPQIVDENEKNPPKPEGYYIVEGNRVEITDYPANWVEENCQLEPTIVQ